MTRSAKTEAELSWARQFQRKRRRLRGYELRPGKPPEPDVCAIGSTDVIGIEITEVVGNRRLRQKESEEDGIVRRAHEIYRSRGLPEMGLAVYWAEGFVASKETRSLAQFLAEVVAEHPAQPGGDVILDTSSEATEFFDHPSFERIWIFGLDPDEKGYWASNRRWWGATASTGLIQREIDRKNGKPAKYRGAYSERWLLIVQHGSEPSSGFDLPRNLAYYNFVSTFDAVFVLQLTPLHVRKLRTRPLKVPSRAT